MYTLGDIKAVEFAFALTVRHIGSLRNLFVCARGVRETGHALIWVCRGAGPSRGRWDVDRERVGWKVREERSLRGGAASLFLASQKERGRVKVRENGEWKEREKRKER